MTKYRRARSRGSKRAQKSKGIFFKDSIFRVTDAHKCFSRVHLKRHQTVESRGCRRSWQLIWMNVRSDHDWVRGDRECEIITFVSINGWPGAWSRNGAPNGTQTEGSLHSRARRSSKLSVEVAYFTSVRFARASRTSGELQLFPLCELVHDWRACISLPKNRIWNGEMGYLDIFRLYIRRTESFNV